jgi:hypothetical protein
VPKRAPNRQATPYLPVTHWKPNLTPFYHDPNPNKPIVRIL